MEHGDSSISHLCVRPAIAIHPPLKEGRKELRKKEEIMMWLVGVLWDRDLSTCSDFSSSFKLLISFSFISALTWYFPWNVRWLLLCWKSHKYAQNVPRLWNWDERIYCSVQHINWIKDWVSCWCVWGTSWSYLLLLNAFYFGLKLEKRRLRLLKERKKIYVQWKIYLLLNMAERLCVLLCCSFTLML